MKTSKSIIAIAWMLGAVLSLSLMAISGRELSDEMSTAQMLLVRNIIGFVIMILVISRLGWWQLKTNKFGTHVLRNVVHFAGQFAWFYGIASISLAEVFALEFTTPIWTVILAVCLLGEKVSHSRMLAIGLGFIGILVMLRPGFNEINTASLVVLSGAFFYACAFTFTKYLSNFDSPSAIVFYMMLIQLPLAIFLGYENFDWPGLHLTPWALGIGTFGLTAHYCMVKSFKLADASVVLPIDFLRLPLIAFLGFLFYEETPDAWVLFGAIVVFLGTWLNLRKAS